MWSGQDSVEPQQLWGTPGHSQNAWANGGSNHSMNYTTRQQPQQWPPSMSMQPQWGYQQQSQQQQWHMPQQQQMGWSNSSNSGYGGYDEKKITSSRGGYSGYGYGGMPQMGQQQPPAWHGQRDVHQQRQPWDNSNMRTTQNTQWGSSSASSQWQNECWQPLRENENPGSGSPGMSPMGFDTWSATGQCDEAAIWRDPKPKKKIRDTGVQAWGDPQIQQVLQDKILRWKDADHEEFQRGPSSSTWNQLHFTEENMRSYANSKGDYTNPNSVDTNDPTVFALHNAFQRALATGLLPGDMKKHPLDSKLKLMVNTLLQKMVKEEQAETELEHIRQLMARGDYPITVAQEHERISNERDGFKTDIAILSDEIKNTVQGSTWMSHWSKGSNVDDGLTSALHSLGIEETPKIPNPAPWQEAPLPWTEPTPISINTDLDRPQKLEDAGGSLDRKASGPQEFIPGKKWEWNDPAKVAEDPNATPGSVKPSFASPNWGNGTCDPWNDKAEKKSTDEEK